MLITNKWVPNAYCIWGKKYQVCACSECFSVLFIFLHCYEEKINVGILDPLGEGIYVLLDKSKK